MLASTLIVKKREGGELDDHEIEFLIEGFCDGRVADYQMSAFAMAVCLNGMTFRETVTLTRAMLESGKRLPRFSAGVGTEQIRSDRPRVDKHSTGGLGDKVSLILAPLLACCDIDVPMVSGRGLGITGGTLDKLESIAGFRVDYELEETAKLLADVGAFIIGANDSIAPADHRLYALRDVTGTVESIPLITASILSKKLSAALDGLVMDVKVGSGAFMKTVQQATTLAKSLVEVGHQAGLPTSALITDMDQPLGETIGNAIEVNESVEVLQGKSGVVRDLTIELGAALLSRVRDDLAVDQARTLLRQAIDSGLAMERFERMIHAQSGRWLGPLKLAKPLVIAASESGTISGYDCTTLGETIVALGGGRRRKGDAINHQVGVSVHQRIGDPVRKGDPILTLYCQGSQSSDYANRLRDAVLIGVPPVAPRPLILRESA